MKYHRIALGIILAALITTWGCSRSTSQPIASAVPAAVQSKLSRLEHELKQVEAARDQARQQVRELESKLNQQLALLKTTQQERDDYKQQLLSRTDERDALQTHFDGFRKNLKEMLTQADAVYTSPGVPTGTPTSAPSKAPFGAQLLQLNKGS